LSAGLDEAGHLVDCVLECGFRHGGPVQNSNQQTRWSAGWLAWIAEWLSGRTMFA
jgi:hypothetical protein